MADQVTLNNLKANNPYLNEEEWQQVLQSRGDIGGPNHEYDDTGLPVKNVYGSLGYFNEDFEKLKQFQRIEALREQILRTSPFQSRYSNPFDG